MDMGIGQWLYKHAQINGERRALADQHRSVTYAELDGRTNQLARSLRSAGVRPGDRVAILAVNSVAYLEVTFAAAKLGAITVPLNYRLSASEIAFSLVDSGSMVVFHSSDFSSVLHDALCDRDVRRPVTITLDHGSGDVYEQFLGAHSTAALHSDVNAHDAALIVYTSGTTGRPKGAVLSHGAVTANAHHALLMGAGLSRYDVTVTPAPLFHVGGLAVHTLPLLYAGGYNYILESFEPRETLRTMGRVGATVQFLVPAMWAAISRLEEFHQLKPSGLRFAVAGGSAAPLTLIEFLQNQGWMFLEGFGMTEVCANAMLLDAEHAVDKRGSVGRPLMHVDARVVDEADADTAPGVVGELVLRGPNLFSGYWGLPAETADAWSGGWFHTGDLARVDDEGFYTLVDRKKDMVITGGENVYPIEVEQVLHRHPAVEQVAVIGVPDETWGEAVTAVIVVREGVAADESEIINFTRDTLAHFKCPKSIHFAASLPWSPTGKLLKRELRQTYAGTPTGVNR